MPPTWYSTEDHTSPSHIHELCSSVPRGVLDPSILGESSSATGERGFPEQRRQPLYLQWGCLPPSDAFQFTPIFAPWNQGSPGLPLQEPASLYSWTWRPMSSSCFFAGSRWHWSAIVRHRALPHLPLPAQPAPQSLKWRLNCSCRRGLWLEGKARQESSVFEAFAFTSCDKSTCMYESRTVKLSSQQCFSLPEIMDTRSQQHAVSAVVRRVRCSLLASVTSFACYQA